MVVTGIAAPASADVQDLTDDDQHHSDPSQRVVSIDTAQAIAGGSPTGAWFVELSRPATSLGGSTAGVNAQQSSFLSTASSQGVSLDVKFEYETLWNGLSVVTDDSNIDAILGMPGVQGVWPVEVVDAPTTLPNNQPDMLSAVTMTGADVAYSELGLDGTGVHVAIMDTGVDYNHPDFGGSGTPGGDTFPTARVTTGYDFVGDDYNADPESDAYQPVPHPDNDPDDCQGHGTHVAGIVGADGDPAAGGVRGVAPGVTFGAYRVFGCDGSTETDIMNAAMERAYQDGADVLNMSIGAAFAGWNDYPTAVLSSRMSDLGMIVVASAGNEGEYGPWAAGAPGNGAGVIGVAMYDNVEVLTDALTLAPSGDQIGYMLAAGSPAPETGTEYTEFTSAGAPGTAGAQACEALGDEFAGTVAVLQRGNCDFYTKALNAQNAGATAVIMYNNAPGLINPTVEGAEEITIPVFFVDQQDGIDVIEQIGTDGFSVTASGDLVSVPNPTGGLINTGSSFGADAELNLKPNIGAPGGSIYSTYPLEDGGYASLTGTSMASPHVAGTVALYLEAHPGTDAATVRDVLQNYSEPALWNGNPDLGYLEATHRQGAGMVQIDEAILAEVIASPGQISLGESVGNLGAGTVNLTSTSDQRAAGLRDLAGPRTRGGGRPVRRLPDPHAGRRGRGAHLDPVLRLRGRLPAGPAVPGVLRHRAPAPRLAHGVRPLRRRLVRLRRQLELRRGGAGLLDGGARLPRRHLLLREQRAGADHPGVPGRPGRGPHGRRHRVPRGHGGPLVLLRGLQLERHRADGGRHASRGPPGRRLRPGDHRGRPDGHRGRGSVRAVDLAVLHDRPRRRGRPDAAAGRPGRDLLRLEHMGGRSGRVHVHLRPADRRDPRGRLGR
jgi:subtilisin family serine protease